MKLIGEFLTRFRKLEPPNDTIKAALANALKDVLSTTYTKNHISIAHGVAYIKASSIAKNAIRVHRAQILEHLFERLPKARNAVRDLR